MSTHLYFLPFFHIHTPPGLIPEQPGKEIPRNYLIFLEHSRKNRDPIKRRKFFQILITPLIPSHLQFRLTELIPLSFIVTIYKLDKYEILNNKFSHTLSSFPFVLIIDSNVYLTFRWGKQNLKSTEHPRL